MPYTLALPDAWKERGWKVKIREDERNEEPHVTIICKTRFWRLSLRTGEFLDRSPPPRDVPGELVGWIRSENETLRTNWDAMYPENPVFSEGE